MAERTEYAVDQLNQYRAAYAAHQASTGKKLATGVPINEWSDPVAEQNLQTARARIHLVLDEISPGWRAVLSRKPWHQSEDAFLDRFAADQVVLLTEGVEIRARLRGDADEIVAQNLHAWVWTNEVARRWHKGEFADAVDEASKSVNYQVQEKVGRRDLGEVKLFQFIYGQGEATSESPRLAFDEANPMTERDRRQGAMQFAAGWFTAVRNLLAHLVGVNLEKYRALEYLAALSIIARWADEASVNTRKAE
jgi:uncharacterized protein (TIGR02391 family)